MIFGGSLKKKVRLGEKDTETFSPEKLSDFLRGPKIDTYFLKGPGHTTNWVQKGKWSVQTTKLVQKCHQNHLL